MFLALIGAPPVDRATGQVGDFGAAYYVGAGWFFATAAYNRWYQGGRTGFTIGRRVARAQLVLEDGGEPPGARMAIFRDVAHLLDSFSFLIGWVIPLWDKKRQTIADKMLHTLVVVPPRD